MLLADVAPAPGLVYTAIFGVCCLFMFMITAGLTAIVFLRSRRRIQVDVDDHADEHDQANGHDQTDSLS